jgi:hypothetical protein
MGGKNSINVECYNACMLKHTRKRIKKYSSIMSETKPMAIFFQLKSCAIFWLIGWMETIDFGHEANIRYFWYRLFFPTQVVFL